MVSKLHLPSLQDLDIVQDDAVEGNYRLKFKLVVAFLRKNSATSTNDFSRIENVRRTFQKHLKGHHIVDGEEYISLTSFLRFIFIHYDKVDLCKSIIHEIENHLLHPTTESTVQHRENEISVLDIYKSISNLDAINEKIVNCLNENSLKDDDITTLLKEHKEHFTDQQWQKVKIFEWHFSRLDPSHSSLNLTDGIVKRLAFLRECEHLLALQPAFYNICKTTISINSERKAAAEFQNGILLHGQSHHIPAEIDSTLLHVLQEVFPDSVDKVVCVSCQTQICKHEKGLHVYIELTDDESQAFSDVCILIRAHINNNHTDHCSQVIWLKHGTVAHYGDPVQRFHMHDEWTLGHLRKETVAAPTFENDEPNSENTCTHCTSTMSHKYPLDWKRFSLIEEWIYHVPLHFQIILGSFLNPDSFRRAVNQSEFINNKIQKLYTTFDILLNILNRCYCGIYQQLCSDELSLSYHSVNTVFSIASQGGATCSFPEAERRLKRQADPSVLYYKAYLEKYPLEYQTDAGTAVQHISLRDCHLILCLDNLVRLTFHKDANRGDARSSQICTLPITIMGLPKDSFVTQSWHDPERCDGSDTCICKSTVLLTPQDVERVFLSQTPEEKVQVDFFQLSITWGLTDLWNSFEQSPEVSSVITAAITTPGSRAGIHSSDQDVNPTDLDVLNKSLQSLDLSEMEQSFLSNSLSSIDEDDVSEIEDHLADYCREEEQDTSIQDDSISFLSQMSVDDQSFQDLDSDIHSLPPSPEPNHMMLHSENQEEDETLVTSNILKDAVSSLGFKIFVPPSLLIRHPPPMEGRDDDPKVLKKILRDILLKTGNLSPSNSTNRSRILFAPDNKIGKNLFKIMEQDDLFRNYLPEFPLLHLRKSKILNLCSAYEDAGLYYLLGFMEDRELEIKRLVSLENIEDATRNIRRISFALHLAFLIKYLEFLPEDEAQTARRILSSNHEEHMSSRLEYHKKYQDFLQLGSEHNGTFALHKELMEHCDEVLTISVAERIGGPDGYNLLLAAVKSSLPFSFLNGASSYAAFCCNLLHAHFSAGPFHDGMKKTFFSTPYRGSRVNFALDSQREMDHRDAIKGFRPRATASSVLPRMSLVDTFVSMKAKKTSSAACDQEPSQNSDCPSVRTWKITKQDVNHIIPTAMLILRQGGLSLHQDSTIRNVYAHNKPVLPETVLDKHTVDVGVYLVKRYAHLNGLCGLSKELPKIPPNNSPKELLSRINTMKENAYTVRRMKCKPRENTSGRDKREKKRKQRAKHLSDIANCITSDFNTCQAVLQPDCTKNVANKASGMKKAIISLLGKCLPEETGTTCTTKRDRQKVVTDALNLLDVVKLETSHIPPDARKQTKIVVVEFAGVKFKTGAATGKEYINFIDTSIVNKTLTDFPKTERIIICEEKYTFTPDDFKADARSKRSKAKAKSIIHLKREGDIISMDVFDKNAACSTSEGKALISTFLASNLELLHPSRPVTLDVDSEHVLERCICDSEVQCSCSGTFAVPIRSQYDAVGMKDRFRLGDIKQRKGEAEMAQIDWLVDTIPTLEKGEGVLSLVTSGDIDAIPIHMFSLAWQWPRMEDGKFKFPVWVLLKKPKGTFDIYNITKIIELLEKKYGPHASMKTAIVLCMGGNDFMLKFNGISHERMIETFISDQMFVDSLIHFPSDSLSRSGSVNKDLFKQFIKHLYCPQNFDPSKLSFPQVRQISIKHPCKHKVANPRKWMPPASALECIASLVDCQIQYLFMAGIHSAKLPNFLQRGCLQKDDDGRVTYFLGEEIHTPNPEHLLIIPADEMKIILKAARKARARSVQGPDQGTTQGRGKRRLEETPQKGQRRKMKPKTSTPRKT